MQILIIGGTGGIGEALVAEAGRQFPHAKLSATWHQSEPKTRSDVTWHKIDASNEVDVAGLAKEFFEVDLLLNAVGFLHGKRGPEKALSRFDPEFFLQNMRLNTLPTLLLAKHFQKALAKPESSLFVTLSARVGSIADNRLGGWYSYRSSKAALNMAVKNISIEWARAAPGCRMVAFHPGTTDTKLSQPFQKNVPDGQLFSTHRTAEQLFEVIRPGAALESGSFLAWDGSPIPW